MVRTIVFIAACWILRGKKGDWRVPLLFFVGVIVGSENMTVPPGSGLTHAASGASNGASNADTRGKYRVTNEEKTVLNAAHSVEKYPED